VTFGDGQQPHQPPHPRLPISVTLWREQMFSWNLTPGTSLWRTSAVRDGAGWDESLARCEDLEFNLRLSRHRVALIPALVLQYRVHAGQVDAAGLTTMFRTAPYLARSPVLAPWLLGLLAKALVSAGAPRLRHARQPVSNAAHH
jgi:hypothetical protein